MRIDKTDYYIKKVIFYAKKLEAEHKRKQWKERTILKQLTETYSPATARENRENREE